MLNPVAIGAGSSIWLLVLNGWLLFRRLLLASWKIRHPVITNNGSIAAEPSSRPSTNHDGGFFSPQPRQQYSLQLRREFSRQRRRHRRQQRIAEHVALHDSTNQPTLCELDTNDVTAGLLTQNVRGLGSDETTREEWLASFRKRTSIGILDAVLLQETHVTEFEIPLVTNLHARQWGYRTGADLPNLSFWSACSGRSAAVAILVHPKSQLINPQPALHDFWGDRFMTVCGTLYGEEVIICNCYVPINSAEREDFLFDCCRLNFPWG